MRPKIDFTNVTKSFNLYKNQSDKLLDIIFFKRAKDNFYALKNLSFKIYEGEAIGIVGLNGSGKSTLSNLLAQIIPPTSGSIKINGETSLIAISVGLNNQLSGLENIELKCLMHGLKKGEIQRLKSEILDFADIGKFVEQPVKNYSSGMKSRLGFAISIHTNPDILIVDEALSVGDQTFYNKCLHKMNEFKSQGKTIIFISHSISQIKEFCDRVMWINFGKIEKFDESEIVIKEYNEFIKWFNSISETEKKNYKTKMLAEQYKAEDITNEFNPLGRQAHRKSKSPVKQRSSSLFSLQFILLFLAVIFSASLMFGANPVQSIEKYINVNFSEDKISTDIGPNSKVSQEVTHREDMVREINMPGIFKTGLSDIFNEKELKTLVGEASFSEEIYVIERIEDNYKIRTDNNAIGYTNIENIKVMDEELPNSRRNITDFLPLFPERFSNAYSYFLTFLNVDSEKVKSKLRGSSEDKLASGEKTIAYSIYDAQYTVNKENMTKSISISNIETNIDEWNTLKEAASMKSNDDQYYYYVTEQYKIVIDLFNKKATVSLII